MPFPKTNPYLKSHSSVLQSLSSSNNLLSNYLTKIPLSFSTFLPFLIPLSKILQYICPTLCSLSKIPTLFFPNFRLVFLLSLPHSPSPPYLTGFGHSIPHVWTPSLPTHDFNYRRRFITCSIGRTYITLLGWTTGQWASRPYRPCPCHQLIHRHRGVVRGVYKTAETLCSPRRTSSRVTPQERSLCTFTWIVKPSRPPQGLVQNYGLCTSKLHKGWFKTMASVRASSTRVGSKLWPLYEQALQGLVQNYSRWYARRFSRLPLKEMENYFIVYCDVKSLIVNAGSLFTSQQKGFFSSVSLFFSCGIKMNNIVR